MSGFESSRCDTATVQLATDDIGRHWEHFFIEGQYSFSNQIPSRRSFTTTQPGTVFYDRGLCAWVEQPSNNNANPNAAAMASGDIGGAGLLLLLGIIGAGVYAWRYVGQADISGDYHPMADVPAMPWVTFNRQAAAAAGVTVNAQTQPDTAQTDAATVGSDIDETSQPIDAEVFEAPWDEPAPTVAEPAPTVNPDTVQQPVEHSPYGIDKLKGVSLKDFKTQLAAHGITAESGAFKSVELLNYEGTHNILHARMWAFWKEFGSRRIPHAIYFVFGLQDGGGRSPAFKEKFEKAKSWVSNWYQENLPND